MPSDVRRPAPGRAAGPVEVEMAKRTRSAPPLPPAVTTDRATRLCRLLRLLNGAGQTRAALLHRLRLDVRGFYRDLQLLRQVGVAVDLREGRYQLTGPASAAVDRLPFPDPHLTLGEVRQIAKGRGAVQTRLRQQLDDIVG
jgi:hypothetical protein